MFDERLKRRMVSISHARDKQQPDRSDRRPIQFDFGACKRADKKRRNRSAQKPPGNDLGNRMRMVKYPCNGSDQTRQQTDAFPPIARNSSARATVHTAVDKVV